jgi:hypothetical protein
MDARTAALVIVTMTPVWDTDMDRYPIAILFTIYRAHGEFGCGESAQLASLVAALALRERE